MKKKIIGAVAGGLLLVPFLASAQTLAVTDVNSISVVIQQITNWISVVFVSIGVLFFIWGAFQWMTAGPDDEKKGSGKSHMINAVIGIFLIISVWGIINLVLSTLGTENVVNTAAVVVDKSIVIPAL